MTSRPRLPAVHFIVWLAASTLLDTEAARAQTPAPAPQRQGQAFDEQFKNRIDEVRAGTEAFVTIFDGTSMNGWSVSAKSRHSSTSGNKTGGHWEVRDGMLVGHQDMPGNGGLFITDKKYGDFEVVLETRNDFGMDSGIYLRSTDTGMAYQVMIDYRRNGSVGGVYGENMKPGFNVAAFHFLDAPDRITTAEQAFPMPVLPASWPTFWRHGQWNEVRARIVGNPARITVWVNGVKFTDYTDTIPRLADGYLALQVHGGLEFVQGKNWVGVDGSTGGETDYTKRHVRFRNVRIKEVL
jgi:hypothetical protein